MNTAFAGAGTGGLATALFLLRQGHAVTLFDRFEKPRPVGSGLMLQQSGRDVLQQLDLLEKVLEKGDRIDRLFGRLRAPTHKKQAGVQGRIVLDVRYARLGGDSYGLGIQRAALFEILYDAYCAAGGTLRPLTRITGPADPRLQGFDLVVDALGARSTLAAVPGKILPYGALWATVDWPRERMNAPEGADLNGRYLEQRYERAKKMAGLMPVGTRKGDPVRKGTFFWSLRTDAVEDWRAQKLDRWKEEVLSLWPQMQPVTDQVKTHDDLTFAGYRHRTLSNPVSVLAGPDAGSGPATAPVPVVHIGDAYHATSPQLGQGANMALLDAAALHHSLKNNSGNLRQALKAYTRNRAGHVRLYQAMSYCFTPMYQSDRAIASFVRDRLIAPASNWPIFRWLNPKIASGTLMLKPNRVLKPNRENTQK